MTDYVEAVLRNKLPEEFVALANRTIENCIFHALQKWAPMSFDGEYPLNGFGIALLDKRDYADGRAPENAYLIIIGLENAEDDFMIQLTANNQVLPWTRVGAKVVPIKPIIVTPANGFTIKTSPGTIKAEPWGFIIAKKEYLKTRNIGE